MKLKCFLTAVNILMIVQFTMGQGFNYSIKGSSDRLADGETIYLVRKDIMDRPNFLLDSTTSREGLFSFVGSSDDKYIVAILNGRYQELHTLILDSMPISFSQNAGITATKGGKDQQLMDSLLGFMNHILYVPYHLSVVGDEYKKANHAILTKYYDRLTTQIYLDNRRFEDSIFYSDPENFNSFFALVYGRTFLAQNSYDKNHDFFSKLSPELKNHEYGRMMSSIINADTLSQISQIVNYKDSAEVTLSYTFPAKGYTLIDFWASWCGPCRVNKKVLQPLYEKYHDSHHFEIIGVTLDDSERFWKDALKLDNSPWINVAEYVDNPFRFPGLELRARANSLSVLTGTFFHLPQYYLLDQQGKIVLKSNAIDELLDMIEKVHENL